MGGCDSSHVGGLMPRDTIRFQTSRQRLVDLKSLETDTNLHADHLSVSKLLLLWVRIVLITFVVCDSFQRRSSLEGMQCKEKEEMTRDKEKPHVHL